MRRYRAELEERTAEIEELLTLAERGRLTLVMGSRDVEHSSAAVLKAYLEDPGRR